MVVLKKEWQKKVLTTLSLEKQRIALLKWLTVPQKTEKNLSLKIKQKQNKNCRNYFLAQIAQNTTKNNKKSISVESKINGKTPIFLSQGNQLTALR